MDIKREVKKIMLIIAFIVSVILTIADQLIKIWAIQNLKGQGTKQFIHFGDTDILSLTYLENDGAVFGSFGGMRWFLIIVTAVMLVACVYVMVRYAAKNKLFLGSMTLVFSGGLGNLIDRIFRGGRVVDYLDVQLFDFAIFNFADCCVVVGVVLLFIYILFFDSDNKKVKEEKK